MSFSSSAFPSLLNGPLISAEDLAAAAGRSGSRVRVVEPARPQGPLMSGRHGQANLRPGMRLHIRDAQDLRDLRVRGEQDAGISVQVFLKRAGGGGASLGGRALLPEGTARCRPVALLTAQTRPEMFERWGRKGTHVCKVSISVSHDWLADSGLEMSSGGFDVGGFTNTHMAQRVWTADPAMVGLARDILRLSGRADGLGGLYLESRAIELLAQGLAGAAGPITAPRSPGAAELRRMRRIEDFLDTGGPGVGSLEQLAGQAGMSVRTLQRLFQAVHGVSAVEFIRRRKLDRARAALAGGGISVKEAAYLAGYSSPANFSTAFRLRFGQSPGQVRQTMVAATAWGG